MIFLTIVVAIIIFKNTENTHYMILKRSKVRRPDVDVKNHFRVKKVRIINTIDHLIVLYPSS